MAKKNAAAQVDATEVAAQTTTEQVVDAAAETTTEETQDAAEAEATQEVTEEKKRERNYSQTAIDKDDLERLTQLKVFVKEKLNVTISNQRIIAAALDCLGENTEAFLKAIAEEAKNKQLNKDRKAYEALKAKFEAMEAPATEATEEATTEAPAAE